MEKVTYYANIDGISLEHMVRYGKFDMRVKHFHNEYEIFYILEGERLFFFNNRNFIASKGDLILVDTNLIYRIPSAYRWSHTQMVIYTQAALERIMPARVYDIISQSVSNCICLTP